jgi:hypothetical protein
LIEHIVFSIPLYLSSGDVEKRPLPECTHNRRPFLQYSLNITSASLQNNIMDRESTFWAQFIPTAVETDTAWCGPSENPSTIEDDVVAETPSGRIRGQLQEASGKHPIQNFTHEIGHILF